MYERYDDPARQTMALANQEAHNFNHPELDTEHILIALIKQGRGGATELLMSVGLDKDRVRVEIAKYRKRGEQTLPMGKLPLSSRAARVLDQSIYEARAVNSSSITKELLLLALLREPEGVAATVLKDFGLSLETARRQFRMGTDAAASG